jgi:hypothetical protein
LFRSPCNAFCFPFQAHPQGGSYIDHLKTLPQPYLPLYHRHLTAWLCSIGSTILTQAAPKTNPSDFKRILSRAPIKMSKPSLSTPASAPHLRQRQRKNLPDYDPDSDLSESEGLGGLRSQVGNTWEDDEETAVDDDSELLILLDFGIISFFFFCFAHLFGAHYRLQATFNEPCARKSHSLQSPGVTFIVRSI